MAIVLQIYFQIEVALSDQFEAMYDTRYRPALRKQDGYQASRLLRIYEAAASAEISAAPTSFNYPLELQFSSEQARQNWVNSSDHTEVWPVAAALAKTAKWRGYHLVASDHDERKV